MKTQPNQLAAHVERSGWWGGFVTGVALGIIWTPCAGPILATIATLASTQAVNLQVVLLTLVYTLGVGVPLFILALLGQRLFRAMRRLNTYTGRIQQAFGAIMIISAVMIGTGYDRTLQAKLLDLFPAYGNFVVNLESNGAVEQQLEQLQQRNAGSGLNDQTTSISSSDALADYGAAPELGGISAWLNTENGQPLTIAGLAGKVVLVDFWTYTCINCIRTLPYVQDWYTEYADDGLVVLGVHTPEFVFERDQNNVAAAIAQYGLTYPVALDNDYTTWDNFANRYWPAKYLIDANGHVRYYHFGEGNYVETEAAIQKLLTEAGATLTEEIDTVDSSAYAPSQTPETYLGTARAEKIAHDDGVVAGTHNYAVAGSQLDTLDLHDWTITGDWELTDEAAIPGNHATLQLHYQASDVYLVITPQFEVDSAAGTITVLLDGAPITDGAAGEDVVNGQLQLDEPRLYHIVQTTALETHTLTLQFRYANVELYAFTFGTTNQ
jgi:thiol-disulfide isomerase/thioredoxin